MMMTTESTRTYTWRDPAPSAQTGLLMKGIDYLNAMIRGEIPPPPISRTLNFVLAEVERGRAVFTCKPDEFHYNPIGTVHGGLACTLLDSALACAVHTLLDTGVGYTSVEMKINFVRPITAHVGMLRAEGKIITFGSTLATSEGRITDVNGKIYAFATETCLILREKADKSA
jgi:uncharacterized protein (TIGR00369 family)